MSSNYNEFFKSARQARALNEGKPPLIRKATEKAKFKLQNEKNRRTEERMELLLQKKVMNKSKRKPFPIRTILMLALGLSVSGSLYLYEEEAPKIFDSVEISLFGSSFAETAKPEGAGKEQKKESEKPAAQAEGASTLESKPNQQETPASNEDVEYFAKLRERKKELDNKESELKKYEEELVKQRAELDKKIAELEDIRRNISSILKDRVEVDNEKVEKLVKIYSKMKPQKAAEAIGKIDQSLAVEILGRLSEKSAAEILNLLEPEKSKTLSEMYSGYRRN